jgi:hypothetical protein
LITAEHAELTEDNARNNGMTQAFLHAGSSLARVVSLLRARARLLLRHGLEMESGPRSLDFEQCL